MVGNERITIDYDRYLKLIEVEKAYNQRIHLEYETKEVVESGNGNVGAYITITRIKQVELKRFLESMNYIPKTNRLFISRD